MQSGPGPPVPWGGEPWRLTLDECFDLLARCWTARIAWCTPEGPEIRPVTVVLDEGSVVFRTAEHGALAGAVRGTVLAVEADGVEPDGSAWSVLVSGPADSVARPGELATRLAQAERELWPVGVRTLFVRVVARHVSGRRVLPP